MIDDEDKDLPQQSILQNDDNLKDSLLDMRIKALFVRIDLMDKRITSLNSQLESIQSQMVLIPD